MRHLLAAFAFWIGLCSPIFAQVALTTQLPTSPITANLTASTTFTTGAATATLTGKAGAWTYICGFTVTSGGTTAALATAVTITGTISGTMNFEYIFVSSGQGVLGIAFGPGCIQSATQGANIVVNSPAGGAGTVGAVTAWGYTN